MANCKYCGKPAGFMCDTHEACIKAKTGGLSLDDIRAQASDPNSAEQKSGQLTAKSIFWAVFGALWAFSLTAGLVYAILRAISN